MQKCHNRMGITENIASVFATSLNSFTNLKILHDLLFQIDLCQNPLEYIKNSDNNCFFL